MLLNDQSLKISICLNSGHSRSDDTRLDLCNTRYILTIHIPQNDILYFIIYYMIRRGTVGEKAFMVEKKYRRDEDEKPTDLIMNLVRKRFSEGYT